MTSISDAYREKNGDVVEQSQLVEGAIARSESCEGTQGEFSPEIINAVLQSALKMFDSAHGGFGAAPKFPHPSTLDLIIEQYSRTGNEELREVFAGSLEKMARGGVYDQLAGGFHRYSVDEHWIVPHFEKMSYDNSELLKNYVHAFQATGSGFFAAVARDIIRWMDQWLSDREHGGFYASQDADYSMDDDGDYFTWTLDEAKAVLNEQELAVASLHYDIKEIGEMHHDPAKNVLYVRHSIEDVGKSLSLPADQITQLLESAKQKMYAARLLRPTPYVDKTVYTGWNALAISAYFETAKVLRLEDARRFALRSLDRILSQAWNAGMGLKHVIGYSDPAAAYRQIPGMLDDYAFTAIACLDAYEATSDLSYFRFAQQIVDRMIADFFDSAGGFFDTAVQDEGETLGVLGTRRKPFRDSPHPSRKLHGRDRAYPSERLHQPSRISSEGATDSERTCWRRTPVRNLRLYLRHCGCTFFAAPYAGRGSGKRRASGKTQGCCACKFFLRKSCDQDQRRPCGRAGPATGLGRNCSQLPAV